MLIDDSIRGMQLLPYLYQRFEDTSQWPYKRMINYMLNKIIPEIQNYFNAIVISNPSGFQVDTCKLNQLFELLILENFSSPPIQELKQDANFMVIGGKLYHWLEEPSSIFEGYCYDSNYLYRIFYGCCANFDLPGHQGSSSLIIFLIQYCIYLFFGIFLELSESVFLTPINSLSTDVTRSGINLADIAQLKLYYQEQLNPLQATVSEGLHQLKKIDPNYCMLIVCGSIHSSTRSCYSREFLCSHQFLYPTACAGIFCIFNFVICMMINSVIEGGIITALTAAGYCVIRQMAMLDVYANVVNPFASLPRVEGTLRSHLRAKLDFAPAAELRNALSSASVDGEQTPLLPLITRAPRPIRTPISTGPVVTTQPTWSETTQYGCTAPGYRH